MWNEKKQQRRTVIAEGAVSAGVSEGGERFSRNSALLLGAIAALEIMIAGAMAFNIDFLQADTIALFLAFVLLYFGIVAVLTDQ